MLSWLRSHVPSSWLVTYHRVLSWCAATWYRHPSRELIVIGVTGTNGKTTTTYLIAKALEAGGAKTGCTSTAMFKIADREWLNDRKMTMLGRFQSQKMLREMVTAGCRYAVVETSSQGIAQNRHRDINYDVVVCTNLTPEHIEAHGGFEAYKQAKLELFRHTVISPRKTFDGKMLPKTAIVNAGDSHAADFVLPGFERVVWFGIGDAEQQRSHRAQALSADGQPSEEAVYASAIEEWVDRSMFTVNGVKFELHLPGRVNVENTLAAIGVAQALHVLSKDVAVQLMNVAGLPGRFERIEEGQPWTVMVDYAPEPAAMTRLYETVAAMVPKRVIHVLGSCGGGRDVARRPVLGRIAADHATYVIVTNEDPYDDNPREIMDQVAAGARDGGKKDDVDLWIIEDRRLAIRKAMELAIPGDLVLLTGKGSEQAICVARGKKIPWDDRTVAREEIRRRMGR